MTNIRPGEYRSQSTMCIFLSALYSKHFTHLFRQGDNK